jgi:hypothetical protein
MAYTTINKSTDYFDTKLYTGNGSTQTISGVGHQPDMTWVKVRSETGGHRLADAVRGYTKYIFPNGTDAEGTSTTNITSWNSDGFALGNGSINENTRTYASWNWKANGAGSSNTDGSINTTSTSVNTTAGFSISSYTGTGSNATVGHGLGVAPKIVIVKNRSSTQGWGMYNKNIGAGNYLALNTTAATASASTIWNSTDPTNSLFSIGTSGWTNDSGNNYIAYCFAEKTGYSKFGSYTGNGNADGTFIYTGFKPAFILQKRIDNAGSWNILDNKREGYNVDNNRLFPDTNEAENTLDIVDILSNGFKWRGTGSNYNNSGETNIYMAFAEAPLVGTNNVPCTAR